MQTLQPPAASTQGPIKLLGFLASTFAHHPRSHCCRTTPTKINSHVLFARSARRKIESRTHRPVFQPAGQVHRKAQTKEAHAQAILTPKGRFDLDISHDQIHCFSTGHEHTCSPQASCAGNLKTEHHLSQCKLLISPRGQTILKRTIDCQHL